MAKLVFVLCAITSIICAFALTKGYRRSKNMLLFWSALCFGFMAANNVFLIIDLIILPELDMNGSYWRNLLAALSGSLLLLGLILESA